MGNVLFLFQMNLFSGDLLWYGHCLASLIILLKNKGDQTPGNTVLMVSVYNLLFLKHLGSQLFPRVGWQIATSQWMYSWSKTEKKHIFENMLQQKVSMK